VRGFKIASANLLGSAMVDLPPFVLSEDRKEAYKVFNSLPIEGQLDIILRARGKERLRCLFLSESPERLIQQLPELEVFLTVKEVGERDALDLISLTTPDQFQYLLDLEFWKKDRLDPEKILQWMEILLESGENKVSQFIQSADPEFIALLLKKFLHVTTLEGEYLEGMDKIPPYTLDHYYFVVFKGKRTREIFQPFLQILYRMDTEGYRRLMDSLIVGLESELEETGYRLRNGRLADHGFPDLEEALEIYRFVNPDSLIVEKKSAPVMDRGELDREGSVFYLTFQNEGPFLSSIFSQVDDPHERDRLRQEIAVLCNKAVIAEAIDLSNIAAFERVVKKVYHYLNLGLQYLSEEREEKATGILRSLPIQRLFQCGVSTTLLLRRKGNSILKGPWFSGDQENLTFLDPPHLEKFEGILKRRPGIYRNGTLEDFKNLQDLKEVQTFLEFVETIANTLGERLHISPRDLKDLDLTGCHPEEWRGITFSTIFLTALANQVLKGIFQFEAIGKARLKDLFSRIFEKDEQGKGIVKMETRKGLREWLDSIDGEENKRQHLHAFGDFCLDLIEEQYGRIPREEEIDPRFVKGLLICT